MRILSALVFVLVSLTTLAVDVPSQIYFAGMELTLTAPLQRMLKADLELITKSQKGYQTKVDRSNLHFPIIEKTLNEEGVPEEFKFLALQESSLVPDAVSSSNAVGYWQMKKETAIEVGLRVDHVVDERMHLIASTHGASIYMKKNYAKLQNWLYALLAYNTGLGGVQKFVETKYIGANQMTLDENTHWYVIRFLAHKLAYGDAVGKDTNPALLLAIYNLGNNKTLREIANVTEVDIQNLELYNKWPLHDRIPDDKPYSVILPVTPLHKQKLIESGMLSEDRGQKVVVQNETKEIKREEKRARNEYKGTLDVALLTHVNRIKAIKAKEADSPAKLAIQGGIAVEDFLRFNDMKNYEAIVPGKVYFLQPKRRKADVMFHTVQDGETLKEISQLYGIKIKAIRTKNRMEKNESLEQGRVLYLRGKRPKDTPVEIKEIKETTTPVEETPVNQKKETPKQEANKEIPVQENKNISTPSQGEAMNVESNLHDVKPGETLYGISRTYSVSVDSIKAWNNLPDNAIQPGMKLVVQKESELKNSSIEHIVMQGETLYQISKKYNVKIEDILSWNNKKDSSVSIGEKLIIKTQ